MKKKVQNWVLKQTFLFSILLSTLMIFLQGCASSSVSKEVNDNASVGYQNAASSMKNMGNGSIADSYENTSQTTRGAILGGATGAVVGSLSQSVGLVPGAAIGAIVGGAYGAYIEANTSLADKLYNRGVKVITLGDQIMLVLRSGRIFNGATAVIRPGAYPTLNLVADYLNTFTTMTVRVAGYTNNSGDPNVTCALTKEQAESIVRYLWMRGVKTRLITAAGMGGTHLVEKNSSDWDHGLNYRIEITTEKLPTEGTLLG